MRPAAALLLGAGLVLASSALPLGAAEQDGQVAAYIAARVDLMRQIEIMAARAEDLAGANSSVTDEMSRLGAGLAADLAAFGLLFPASTNLPGGAPAPEGVTTTAAAAIWDDFAAFYAQARKARDLAVELSTATDFAAYFSALTSLRATCTSCHETYVVYDPFAAIN
jgi:cytochrome c556